jgi:hypothetical protein
VAIWNSVLTSEQISTISTAPSDLSTYNPIAWYRMGDNSTYQTPQILMPSNENKNKVSNWSLQFDGVDDTIDLGLISELNNTSAYTLSMWVNPSVLSGLQYLFALVTSSTERVYINLNNTIPNVGMSNGTNTNESFNSAPLTVDTWHHLAVVFDGTQTGADRITFYLNGVAETTTKTTWDSTTPTFVTNAFLSNYAQFGLYYFNGKIDETAIYNTALTSEQITSIYNGGEPTTITGATAYWKLGEQAKFTDNWLVPNSALSNYSKFSFNLDGVDDYISVTANPLTDFTVSFWINPSTSVGANFDGILGQGTTSPQGGILRYVAYDGTASVGNVLIFLGTWTTVASLTNGEWSNVILTYDSTLDELKSYKNGSLYTTISNPNFSGQTTNAHSFERIGLRNVSGTEFAGALDEIAVWDSALTDISSIYNSGEPTTISGAVAHWRMGEDATYNSSTSQWTIPDQVGSNDGTSSNTMALDTLVGEAPNYFGGGLSDAMTIEDRVGDAPNSENNAVSYNMEADDIDNNTP